MNKEQVRKLCDDNKYVCHYSGKLRMWFIKYFHIGRVYVGTKMDKGDLAVVLDNMGCTNFQFI